MKCAGCFTEVENDSLCPECEAMVYQTQPSWQDDKKDQCPKCGHQLDEKWSGVKCPECNYQFCY